MNNDSISRTAAIDAFMEILDRPNHAEFLYTDEICGVLCNLPSAQPERKKGRWIRNDNGTYSCSICQSWIPEEQHHYARYCLYCGADMREC